MFHQKGPAHGSTHRGGELLGLPPADAEERDENRGRRGRCAGDLAAAVFEEGDEVPRGARAD